MDDDILVFGETNFRNQKLRFGIKPDDRARHMYLIGKTGMGKTAMIQNMIVQDIQAGRGVAYVDPHGDTAEALLDYIPEERIKDVIYFDPADTEFPMAFNILEKVSAKDRHLVASGLMAAFKKIWEDMWSARMEYILNNTILALLEVEGETILGVNRMFSDKAYRSKIVAQVTDPLVRAFWEDEFAKYTERIAIEATASIQNKVGQFVSSTLIRNIVGQTKTSFDVRQAMDNGKIIILNLARGKIGEDASRLLGALFITKIQLAAMSRADIPERERKNFYLYVDEFQHFATASFANILSEARKFRLNLVMAHQYIAQMEEEVRDAVFGNVGTIAAFRVGAEDAEMLEKEFAPEFAVTDIVNLAKYTIYIKLMIDGVSSRAFSANTLPPFSPLERSFKNEIIESSRSRFGTPVEKVEKAIAEWAQKDRVEKPSKPSGGSSSYYKNNSSAKDSKVSTVSLNDAMGNFPVDFKGRSMDSSDSSNKGSSQNSPSHKNEDKKGPDLQGLRDILNKTLEEK